MASEYSWYIQNRIVYAHVYDIVTVDDLHKGNTIISEFFAQSPTEPIHILFDLIQMERTAFTLGQVRTILTYLRSPKLGWIVVFGTHGALKTLITLFGTLMTRLSGMCFYHCGTLDEALTFLKSHDATLNDLDIG